MVQAIQRAGINLALFAGLEHVNLTNEQAVASILRDLHGQIEKALTMTAYILLLSEPARLIRGTQMLLGGCEDSGLCQLLLNAILERDTEAYAQHFAVFLDVTSKMPLLIRRHQLLGKIKQVAPMWAEAISQRVGIHGLAEIPASIQESWQLKQLDIIVQRICTTPLSDAERRVSRLKVQYQRATEELATALAWYLLSKRITGNLRIRSALIGWKQTIKRIGKGTGKNARELKKRAQELMADSQQAVPAWIMPIGKVMDSIDPSKTKFDIVIIDEASQADITAIPILFMGKKVIVVGDDEQVSPMAVGIPEEKIKVLKATYIKDRIPNWHLYDASYSIYDLAGSICKPLMLREHFRCVPDIIGYSNWLSYEGRIKPLREAGNDAVQPAVIPFRVEGQRKGKTNLAEAEAIVAAIQVFMEMPEYRNETFGIISMLGDEQVKLIDKLLYEHIHLVDRENRRILCGTASDFQGDERSVILLSLVDSNEGDGPLRKITEGKSDSTKQRYNVAVSRAQNQIWIVHSMDPAVSLKTGDLRRDLLDYAKDPKSYGQKLKQVEGSSESIFEEGVAKSLVTAGYQVTQQYPVGGYRLDMVVSCKGKRIALECDGERYHSSEEEIRNDVERQNVLERLGWQFIRLRGSEYFRDKERAMERIKQNLNEAGIVPEASSICNTDFMQQHALKQKVATRIQQIVRSWHSDDDDYNPIQEPDRHPIAEKPATQPQKQTSIEQFPVASNGRETPTATNTPIPIGGKDAAQQESMPGKPSITPSPVKPVHAGHPSSGSEAKPVKTPAPGVEQIGWGDLIPESKLKGGFLEALDAASFEYIDNRSTSGILWVLYSVERKVEFEQLAAANVIKASLEKRGAVATANRPAWRIMENHIKE
ncbi:AAA domain-containing protein [Bacillota bacterium Meth-B3]